MKNNTTIKVPKKYVPMLDEIDHDSDGYWAYTKAGYYFPYMDCHTAHEDTQKELMRVVRGVAPCDCDECKKMIEEEKRKEAEHGQS